MENTSKISPIPKRDLFYYRQRMKNRVFTELASFFANEAAAHQLTKRLLAYRLQSDPASITRWLSAPSNLTLETISDLLLALDAEMDTSIVRFSDRATPNYVHPVIAHVTKPKQKVVKRSMNDNQIGHSPQPKTLPGNRTGSSGVVAIAKVLEPA